MPYTPEEYESLKAFYKKDLLERKAILEQLRRHALRQKAEWHLQQMEASLRGLGLAETLDDPSSSQPSDPESTPPPSDKSLL
ncbi:MAG: hypothetical protein N3E49_05880 [Bacteroidia bacterium]|nr:hypothetical protein [Bacteroidia bacterium]